MRTIDATADLFTALGLAVAVGGASWPRRSSSWPAAKSSSSAADPLRLLFAGALLAASAACSASC